MFRAEVHLTNYAVQSQYADFSKHEDGNCLSYADLGSIIDLERFKE
jgi:hypothetical protein